MILLVEVYYYYHTVAVLDLHECSMIWKEPMECESEALLQLVMRGGASSNAVVVIALCDWVHNEERIG